MDRFILLGLPFHGAAGVYGFAGLWFALLLGGLPLPADELVEAPASLLEGRLDDIPAAAFYFAGGIGEIRKRAASGQ